VSDLNQNLIQIVDTAAFLGIGVISITDHNSVSNVTEAIRYSAGKGILVIPGVEVSTNQGHLLLYAARVEDLTTVLARLDFSHDMCTNTIVQCLEKIKEFGGFGIAAHIDKQKGFEFKITGYGEDKKQLFLHPETVGC